MVNEHQDGESHPPFPMATAGGGRRSEGGAERREREKFGGSRKGRDRMRDRLGYTGSCPLWPGSACMFGYTAGKNDGGVVTSKRGRGHVIDGA